MTVKSQSWSTAFRLAWVSGEALENMPVYGLSEVARNIDAGIAVVNRFFGRFER